MSANRDRDMRDAAAGAADRPVDGKMIYNRNL